MAIITPSATVYSTLGDMQIGQRDYSLEGGSDATGELQIRLYGPPRWQAGITSTQALTVAELGEWEALVMRLRGKVNHLQLYDAMRPAPRGTMRGTLTTYNPLAVGDTVMYVESGGLEIGKTWEPGDWVKVGNGLGTSQLFKSVTSTTSNGAGQVAITFEPPARIAFASGSPVTWNKPTGYYKLAAELGRWTMTAGAPFGNGFALDLLEQWS